MKKLFVLAATTAIVLTSLAQAADISTRRPNIIVIFADDLGYECIGANGGQSYKTPVLDRLAAGGMRFDHCYAQPLCTPSRAQIMTGMYNVRNYVHFGIMDWEQTTFANLLQKAGYATCIVGKWQLQGGFEGPGHFGFDEYCLWQLNRRPGRYAAPGLEINGKQIDYPYEVYGPDIVNDYALDFIDRHKDKPFLLYYPMILTHNPFDPTPDSDIWGKRHKKEQARGHRYFGDMVTYMDKLIGKLVDRLEQLDLADNTLILFTGDNGTTLGVESKLGDRMVVGGKSTPTDAGMHVPGIAYGPGIVRPGQVSNDLVDLTDFLPTICSAAGVEIPSSLTVDGRSFLPQLRGEKGSPREWIYCWYSKDGKTGSDLAEFARNQSYKLYRDGRLFDVRQGDDDTRPMDKGNMTDEAHAARKLLQAALDEYRDARPERIAKLVKRSKSGSKE